MSDFDETYEISEDCARLDFERIHCWLASSYWSPGIDRCKVEKAAAHSSLVLGAYLIGGEQVGYMRVVSDQTTFAWICDVIVAPDHRGKGIGANLVDFALKHPDYQGLRRWTLATLDAHVVYAKVGFVPLPNPERWMAYLPGETFC